MWLVGYAYNHNGMGSWCLEAAHALADAGEPVALVCSPELKLPEGLPFEVLRVRSITYAPTLAGRLSEELHRLSTAGPRVMRGAIQQLGDRGVTVRALLLNSSEFFDPSLSPPQLVTAWARDITLGAYLARLRTHLQGVSLHSWRMTLDAIGWWRRDWFAFRGADLVLGVSQALTDELQRAGVRAVLLHPCISLPDGDPRPRAHDGEVHLVIVAESLALPRKRVVWMLEALRDWNVAGISLTLLGEASSAVREAAQATGIPVHFLGRVAREEVQRAMRDGDVFLFASLLDDWGYVLAEAMSHGMAVVAPDASPFDEIVGRAGVRFAPSSPDDFRRAVVEACDRLDQLPRLATERARTQFSRQSFVTRLHALMTAHDLRSLPGDIGGGSR